MRNQTDWIWVGLIALVVVMLSIALFLIFDELLGSYIDISGDVAGERSKEGYYTYSQSCPTPGSTAGCTTTSTTTSTYHSPQYWITLQQDGQFTEYTVSAAVWSVAKTSKKITIRCTQGIITHAVYCGNSEIMEAVK